jgi:murein DD-endopeptidase MepM/ murein hydrolase activator NlpD
MNQKEFIKAQIAARKAGTVICPAVHPDTGAPYFVTTPYHEENPPGQKLWRLGYHTGEDHTCPTGSLAVAPSWGTVIATGPHTSYGADFGNIVVVRKRDQKYDYMFCHLSEVLVEVGQKVKPGMVVGHTGHSGNVEPPGLAGSHLHFEARKAGGHFGDDVDPLFVKQAGFQG